MYGYVVNDPVNLIDPSGLIFQDLIAKYTTPQQQANLAVTLGLIGTGTIFNGMRTGYTGVLTTIIGGLLVKEGYDNYKHATSRMTNPFGIPDFNDVNFRNPSNNMCLGAN